MHRNQFHVIGNTRTQKFGVFVLYWRRHTFRFTVNSRFRNYGNPSMGCSRKATLGSRQATSSSTNILTQAIKQKVYVWFHLNNSSILASDKVRGIDPQWNSGVRDSHISGLRILRSILFLCDALAHTNLADKEHCQTDRQLTNWVCGFIITFYYTKTLRMISCIWTTDD